MKECHTKWLGKNRIHKELIDSTNSEICRLAIEGAEEGTVVTADVQTAGKGRRGRSWESEPKASLLFSILLRPKMQPDKAPQLTLLMALAVTRTLRTQTGLDAFIKWPNDIVIHSKKVCGILTQMQLNVGEIDSVVVGTGVNVSQKVMAPDLEKSATSLFLELEQKWKQKQELGGQEEKYAPNAGFSEKECPFEETCHNGGIVQKETLLAGILAEFERDYELFLQKQNLSDWIAEYNERLVSLNREVKVLDPKGEFIGISKGINENGELLVELPNGEVTPIYAGEVSVRGLYGYV